jgi:hypothetical protein
MNKKKVINYYKISLYLIENFFILSYMKQENLINFAFIHGKKLQTAFLFVELKYINALTMKSLTKQQQQKKVAAKLNE